MLIEIGRTTRIGEEDVVVIAHGLGLHGAEQYIMSYSYQFNLEELISSVSVTLGIEFYKAYGEECTVTCVRIFNEADYEEWCEEHPLYRKMLNEEEE